MQARLTDAYVASLQSATKDRFVFDTQQTGYRVRVTPTGTKLLQASGYVAGAKRAVTLGRHPDLTVSAGRELALQALADMRRGCDPVLELKTRQAAVTSGAMLTSELADKWLTDYVRPRLKSKTISDYEKLVAKHIWPVLGRLPVKAVTRDDVIQLHNGMKRTPRRANYAVSVTSTIFNFAEDLGLRPRGSNPARKIKRFRERAVERFLSEAEYAKASAAIEATERSGKIGPYAAAGLKLCMCTGARSGEITAAKWTHVDWDRKLIRLPDSKTNTPRTIYLNDAAREVLRTIPRRQPYIIAGTVNGKAYTNLGRAWIITRKSAGLDYVRLHDLRHSYASLAASRGVSLHMIGKLLGHRTVQTTSRYSHLTRDHVATVNDEVGAAMQAAIEKGSAPSAGVVKLRRPRRR